MYTTIITICDHVCYKWQHCYMQPYMSPTAIERDVMWVCYPCAIFISVKVSPLLCFQNSKVLILSLEEDRKAIAFDLEGWLFILAYICHTRNKQFDAFHIWLFVKCLYIHGMVYKELYLHYILTDKQGKCSHKCMKHELCYTMFKIVKVP